MNQIKIYMEKTQGNFILAVKSSAEFVGVYIIEICVQGMQTKNQYMIGNAALKQRLEETKENWHVRR